eukprot:gene3902-4871_t
MAAGVAVDYGYDKLMSYANIAEAKATFSTYLQSWDADLNKEQADILANVPVTLFKEAGRVLTHKYASKGMNLVRDRLRVAEQQPIFTKEYGSGKINEGLAKEKIKVIREDAKNWLGEDYSFITNKSGDDIFMSKDGLRKIRFDIKNPHGDAPHIHLEMQFKIYESIRDTTTFRIEEDYPEIGVYLYIIQNVWSTNRQLETNITSGTYCTNKKLIRYPQLHDHGDRPRKTAKKCGLVGVISGLGKQGITQLGNALSKNTGGAVGAEALHNLFQAGQMAGA